MSFGREKRLWLGALALLVPVPLPFNQVLEWPYFFVYALFVIHFLQRAERGTWITLPNWALNVLGLVAMPFIAFDLRAAFLRGSVVTALAHLMMFLLVVKLYSIRREKEKWHIMVAVFFLFVGAMATSSHVTIAPYLLAFLVSSLMALARFAHLHVITPLGESKSGTETLPFRPPLVAGTLLVLVVAVPLFATMPRIHEPYILGRGTGSAGMARTTGFSDSVDLSLTTSIRANRDVALRVRYEDETQLQGASGLRFKGAAYERYENRNWFRALRQAEVLIPQATETLGRYFELAAGASGVDPTPINKAEVFLQPIGSSSLLLPMEAVSLELELQSTVGIDPGGAVLLPVQPRQPLRYQVGLAAGPMINAKLDPDPEGELSALHLSGLTPSIAELARQVMSGEESTPPDDQRSSLGDGERIDRLEQHLLTQYTYTLDYLGRFGDSPIEDFLFVYKSGHCELFASAMVLMLRSQGIPARLVTGFLGAELNPLEGYYVVRQQNAHAWVEAHTESRGWRVYDPTPPDGRPSVAPQSLGLLVSQIYDYVTFRWDRYVLTYGAEDQEGFFRRMRERLHLIWGRLRSFADQEPTSPEAPFVADTATHDDVPAPWIYRPRLPLPLMLAIFAAVVALLVAWHRSRPLSGKAAYLRLRRRLERAGLETTAATAPLDFLERATVRLPAAGAALRYVVSHYVRESFAGRDLDGGQRRELPDALRAVDAKLKQDRRRQRQQRRPRRAAQAA